jgi:hypothetical protein
MVEPFSAALFGESADGCEVGYGIWKFRPLDLQLLIERTVFLPLTI